MSSDSSKLRERSPAEIVTTLAISVFVAEVLVMAVLYFAPPMPEAVEALVDATLLTLILAPVFHFLIFRSLLKNLSERKRLENELRQSNFELHENLRQRTTELEATNRELNETIEELKRQSVRDALTGLYNRRYLDEVGHQLVARAKREAKPMCVAMFDIDHFKKYNDKHGHAAGDAALEAVGQFLRAHIREFDVVCRYGGEEFAILMSKTNAEAAALRCEQIRNGVSELNVALDGEPLSRLTISGGMAIYPDHGSDLDALLRRADEALYQAKEQGRNRVVLAEKTDDDAP